MSGSIALPMSSSKTTAVKETLSSGDAKTLETLPFEYQWPQDSDGEYYFVETQLCDYLKEDSLLQKFPEIQYHEVTQEERKFLFEQGAITESDFNYKDKKVLNKICYIY